MIDFDNILMHEFATQHGLPPFDRIKTDMYEPAIRHAMALHQAEIAAITSNEAPPSFDNTIVALERSGADLSRVLGVFYAMLNANADDELMQVAQRVSPTLSEHGSSISLNEELWQRVKSVKERLNINELDDEDAMLLENTVTMFERSGATLKGADRETYRSLKLRLTQLSIQFEQNLLKQTNAFELWLTDADLDGLPESAVEAAKSAASQRGREDAYLVTLHAPSYTSFMKYSNRRDLRERLYRAYNSLCGEGVYSNMNILTDIANTRLEIARLFGFNTFADYRLQRTMAGNTENVMRLLDNLRDKYMPVMAREMADMQSFAGEEILPWDYSFIYNKMRDIRYKVNDELLRPYFPLDRVCEGVLGLATRLYGLHFTPNPDAQVWDSEVKVWNVSDEQGDLMGVLYADFFPRSTKQSGAWMTCFTEQHVDACDNDHRPQVTLTMNFTRPTSTKPSLLTYGEVNTFLHEFGHGLHALLSRVRYESLSCTNVYRDFVELPSQFNENFLRHREFIDTFARHYVTGEPVPDELLDGIIEAERFGVGYSCVRQLGFGYLDMAWHTITEPVSVEDALEFERRAMSTVQVFEPVEGCMMSPHFSHIFAGGYAAGYYGYKWAEVLDADAFEYFSQDMLFDRSKADKLRATLLSRGGSVNPMQLYVNFRGREPRVDALLRRDGLLA